MYFSILVATLRPIRVSRFSQSSRPVPWFTSVATWLHSPDAERYSVPYTKPEHTYQPYCHIVCHKQIDLNMRPLLLRKLLTSYSFIWLKTCLSLALISNSSHLKTHAVKRLRLFATLNRNLRECLTKRLEKISHNTQAFAQTHLCSCANLDISMPGQHQARTVDPSMLVSTLSKPFPNTCS